VAGPVGVPGFLTSVLEAGVEVLDLSGGPRPAGGLTARVGRVLSLVQARTPRTVAFWNLDAAAKLAIAKVLADGPVRLVDVSPGPMLYSELARAAGLARSLSTAPAAYLASLAMLVAKYQDGGPPAGWTQPPLVVIPNGVPEPPPPLAEGDGPAPPPGADPALAVVTVGRLAPVKRPELLPQVARALARRVPGATLTVVGGAHATVVGAPGSNAAAAWQAMLDGCGHDLPGNLVFAGPDHRAGAFLARFAVFYMVSEAQGCPNASLEAMASGLPVVANPDGGTGEQVEDGVTGRLVADPGDPAVFAEALAAALADLLLDPALRRRLGAAGQAKVRTRFGMARMADAYAEVLRCSSGCGVPSADPGPIPRSTSR
jgi:glycosyltransferase involved in cell wall biosynthesis